MTSFRHRPRRLPALVLLIAAAGCTTADDGAPVPVPSPDAKAAGLCRNLDSALPPTVDGLEREDPSPASKLTAGWGNPVIILRCGVERPAEMDDPAADGVEVDGVGWQLLRRDDGGFRFTTTLREAYVEVTIPAERADGGMAPLVDLAPAVKKAIPEGIAS